LTLPLFFAWCGSFSASFSPPAQQSQAQEAGAQEEQGAGQGRGNELAVAGVEGVLQTIKSSFADGRIMKHFPTMARRNGISGFQLHPKETE
jgi:hypothetical protein